MENSIATYRKLEDKLSKLRAENLGLTKEIDTVLTEMENIYFSMDDEEREIINGEPLPSPVPAVKVAR